MSQPIESNGHPPARLFHSTGRGKIFLGDSLSLFRDRIQPKSVDLIVTSPPFGLVRKKDYGNVDAHDYVNWFKPFGAAFHSALKPAGSLVIDIGGAWISGQPTRSLYHYELLIMLCREFGFHLAQEFFWWNPARLPTPAEWVTVRRIRVKDAVNCIWWLSPTPWPKASNRRVLQPYSDSMKVLLEKGYKPMLRPSGHDISNRFSTDNGAAIPPNLLALAHTESNSAYIHFCREKGIAPHPARFPSEIPEFFIRMLTDRGDLVVDPFAGSCTTGEAAERTDRNWLCCEMVEEYLAGAIGRFQENPSGNGNGKSDKPAKSQEDSSYRIYKPGGMWKTADQQPLALDGGAKRQPARPKSTGPAPVTKYPSHPRSSQMALLEEHKSPRSANGSAKRTRTTKHKHHG
jgi:site-specific DNA-methyltransferase (cytosine-N4-specific)